MQQCEMDEIKAGSVQIHDAQAKTLGQLIADLGDGTSEEKEEGLVKLDYASLKPNSEKGTLACLDAKPGPTNAGEVDHFTACMDYLFKKTPTYLYRKERFMHQVWEYQVHLCRLHWMDKRKKQDPEVHNTDFNWYTWRAQKMINTMTQETRSFMALHLVGD